MAAAGVAVHAGITTIKQIGIRQKSGDERVIARFGDGPDAGSAGRAVDAHDNMPGDVTGKDK